MLPQADIGLRTMISEHLNGNVVGSDKIVDDHNIASVTNLCVSWRDSMVHNRIACNAYME